MITLTAESITKIKEIVAEINPTPYALRIFVQGGGCSGFQYGFTFDNEKGEDDFEFEFDGVKLLVDSMSNGYLQGATVDYKKSLQGEGFSISNPNAQATCGCGSSFAV